MPLALLNQLEHSGDVVGAPKRYIGGKTWSESALRALVLTHVLWVDKIVYALRQADGDPAALAGPALQHSVKLSLVRSETHVVSGYIGFPCWLGAQDGFANFLVKLPVEPALGKGGMVLLQGPGSRLASLAARRAVLVYDLG